MRDPPTHIFVPPPQNGQEDNALHKGFKNYIVILKIFEKCLGGYFI